MMKKKLMATSDPFIISRVKQYLEENVHQTYVDVATMAKSLQERYEEYGRRKTAPFRAMVEQAYKTVLHSYGLDSNPSSDDNNASDLEFMDSSANPNHMNDMLTNLYSKQANKNKQSALNETESIDIISSDDSGDEKQEANKRNNNNNNTKLQATQASLQQQLAGVKTVILSKFDKTKSSSNNATTNKDDDRRTGFTSVTSHEAGPLSKKRKINNQSTGPNEKERKQLKGGSGAGESKPSSPSDGNDVSNSLQQTSNRGTKRFKKTVTVQRSVYLFRDVAGIDKTLKELCEILFHIKHPEIYHTIGLSPPRGILLHGPPGCGKTLLAHAIAGQLKVGIIEVPATELIGGVSGESEERIREIFEQALLVTPCVLFIDDIDAISSNRLNAQKDMERRVVSQLISCMDNLLKHISGESIIVIGATTRPECLDPALRRVGRFDHEIALGVPDKKGREEILKTICEVLSLEMPFDYKRIAELTPGYVGADLLALVKKAASIAGRRRYINKISTMQENITIVDLDDESLLDASNIISKKCPQNKTVEESTPQTQEQSNEQNDENQSGVDVTAENKSEEKTEEANVQNNESNIEVEQSDKDDAEKMDVDSNKVEETEKDENVDETIDVDEIPDKVPESVKPSEPEETENANKENKEKNGNITNKKHTLSLFEMINILSSDYIQIHDSELEEICIKMCDFEEALKCVQPSAKREGFITVPDVTWDDIGSLHDIREELQLAILAPVKYPEKMEVLGLTSPSGVLLCGPPGCGKTLLAKAIANEAGINFISVKGPELMNMYVGESERAVRTCFQRARNSAPCVIFFDEFDSLCPKRSDSLDGGSGTRVVNQLLTEMDGIEDRKGVFLMAATNRPDIIDPAILRPGRLDKILFVGLPEQKDRVEILEALTKHRTQPVLDDDVDLLQIAIQTDGFTGADLSGLVRQASLLALKDSLLNPDIKTEDLKVTNKHFENAVKLVRPSVTPDDKKMYDKLKQKYTKNPLTEGDGKIAIRL